MTKFLRNSWYCAGWSTDVTDNPVGIKILSEEIVLFRTSDGTLAALNGRCPHRFAALSLGCIKGDLIECGYHGLQFDKHGVCRLNPHGQGKVPPRAHTRSYPAVERDGALWVWMGDPALADPADIMDLYFVGQREGWTGVTGYLKINADYQLVIDNLLDLTHATYLHPNTVGVDPEHSLGASLSYDFKTEGNIVRSNYTFRNSPPTALFKPFYPQERGDIFAFMRWEPAGALLLDISTTGVGMPKGTGVHMPSAHLIVPETEQTCHYFFALSRDVELDNEAKTKTMGEVALSAFIDEDEPVIHRCHELMNGAEFFELEPAILETDIAGIQARRILAKLIRQEQPVREAAEAA
ncbi:aromatic ring-hydroxylating dioxygenase subunit alpha [Sphingobium boeckii]|uniref:Vanillate O-demethylase monooxygenase subunit n=1 Tax=Sphingobium boeckii TaxID=1082345 RepID=A0A7W9EEP8_9SPHN|nr:aromatic ring-hydroxylating dioxygenase subunit alpha [Sphingobium boeckii]MBB5684891.1 vanillate O-demethylase monooxygenase subunit [Sphingobium boeckii]